ncbi:Cell wall-associated polypeptide CWBP200 [Bacteroidales bacterium Barb6XT]|nr:Cell wall-associated polypeptide CWBP200 [Bacteroidales bacterium Barb6XT]
MKSLLKAGLLAILFGICPVQAQEANNSATILFDSLVYDKYDRPVKGITPEGSITETEYAGHKTTVRVGTTWKTTEYSPKKVTTSVTDPSGTVYYYTRADGNPEKTVAPGNITTVFHYDKYGRPTGQTDPSFGTNLIEYDAAGNVIRETDADGRVFSATYDRFNRQLTSVSAEDTVTYTYIRQGEVASIRSSNGSGTEYTYDPEGRILRQKQYDGSQFLLEEITYGATGEVTCMTYTSDRGLLGKETCKRAVGEVIEKFWNGTSVFHMDEANALGHTTSAAIGGSLCTWEYSPTGIPCRQAIEGIMDVTYDFDRLTGHLLSQTDNRTGKTNTYTYDNLNRLTSYGDRATGRVHTMTYDPNGNILAKSDIDGSYRYETPGKPYAVSHVEQASPVKDLDLIYSSIQRPLEIKGRDRRIAFKYDGGNYRVRMSTYALAADSTENLLSVRTYFGGYECDSSAAGVTERFFFGGNPYSAPLILLKREGQEAMYSVARDFLGSIVALADSSGRVVESRTYDPWGRMTREAADSALCITDRGYTSHEHIEEIGLINMNARLYDPLIGRFFSPDPKMMDGETQALNRYSYAMNNPLAYTDPSGEELILAIVSMVTFVATLIITAATTVTLGAVAGAVMTGVTLAGSGASAGEMAWKIPAAMVIGGAAGAAGGVLGAGMPAFGAAGLALSGVASIAAASLIGSTTSFLTGENTLSVGLLSYNFNRGGLENPFGGVQQSIFSSLDIAGMVLPAVGGVASALTARGAASAESSVLSPANRQLLKAVWEAEHPHGHLPGGFGNLPPRPVLLSYLKGGYMYRTIDGNTPIPQGYRLNRPIPRDMLKKTTVLNPKNWRFRESIYGNRKRNTRFDWGYHDFQNPRTPQTFKITDTYYIQYLREERDNFRSRLVENAYRRITRNMNTEQTAQVRYMLDAIQRNYKGFPYSRLTAKSLDGFWRTSFNSAKMFNGDNYISLTLPARGRLNRSANYRFDPDRIGYPLFNDGNPIFLAPLIP